MSQKMFSRKELQNKLKEAIARVPSAQYAIGGAVGMSLLGYSRSTKDVDVFVLESSISMLLTALREVGLVVFPVFEPFHFAAKLPGDPDPERRIDILVPAEEPELSGVERAIIVEHRGFGWRVFPHGLLATAKFLAAQRSGDIRHLADFVSMLRRGMFDASSVRSIIEFLDMGELPAYDAAVASAFRAPSKRDRREPGKRLPPDRS